MFLNIYKKTRSMVCILHLDVKSDFLFFSLAVVNKIRAVELLRSLTR